MHAPVHNEQVAEIAVETLTHFESNASEQALLQMVRKQPRGMETCFHMGVSHLTKRAMKTRTRWNSSWLSSSSEALQSLLSMPYDHVVGERSEAMCVDSCLREHCNPHIPSSHCTQRCSRCCVHQQHVVHHTKAMLRRAAGSDEQSLPNFGLVLLLHAFDWNASFHKSVRSMRRLHESGSDAPFSLAEHLTPSRDTHSSHLGSWILPAVQEADLLPVSSSWEPIESMPARRQLLGLKSLLVDSARMVQQVGDLLKSIDSAAENAMEISRQIRAFYAKIEAIADKIKLTFIDLVLTHTPIEFHFFAGKENLIGPLGGAGVYADLVIKNSAIIEVGMFGAKFDIDLDDFASVGGLLAILKIPYYEAGLRFKATATIAPPIPTDLLGKAGDVIFMIFAAGESIKRIITKYIERFVRFILKLLPPLDLAIMLMPVFRINELTEYPGLGLGLG